MSYYELVYRNKVLCTETNTFDECIEALEKHRAPLVLWSSQLDYVSPRPGGNHLGPLQSYLRSRYHVAKTFGNCDQVWERNDSAR